MKQPFRVSTSLVAALFAVATVAQATGCRDRDGGTDRWVTTDNTNVKIDWDKVNEAYKLAEGPEDFEKRVNEIYEGDEVVSVAVQDLDASQQVVTGFFDKNTNGAVEDEEKIFTIQRTVTGEGAAQYETMGYGPAYGYYHSPMLSIVSGMVIGSMLSNAFRPNYVPVYTRPYTTTAQRATSLHGQRSSYRAANPSRFSKPKPSGTGRSYGGGSKGGRSGGGRSGGGRFGISRARRGSRPQRPQRLDA
jgi:hypothetical protein